MAEEPKEVECLIVACKSYMDEQRRKYQGARIDADPHVLFIPLHDPRYNGGSTYAHMYEAYLRCHPETQRIPESDIYAALGCKRSDAAVREQFYASSPEEQAKARDALVRAGILK